MNSTRSAQAGGARGLKPDHRLESLLYRLDADEPARHARRKCIGLSSGSDIWRPGRRSLTFCSAINRRPRLSPGSGPSFCFPTPARSSTSSSGQIDSSGKNCERPARWTRREGAPSDASTADTQASLEHLSGPERQSVELLSHLHEYAISCADETRLLVDGGAFFAALGQRIDEARHHVHHRVLHLAGRCACE